MTPTDRPTGAAPRSPGHHAGHLPKPSPSDLDGEATDCAEELAREEALRASMLRVPR